MDRLSTQINPKKPVNSEQQMALDDIARLRVFMSSLNNPEPQVMRDLLQMLQSSQYALSKI